MLFNKSLDKHLAKPYKREFYLVIAFNILGYCAGTKTPSWALSDISITGFLLQDFRTNSAQADGHDRFREWRLDVEDMSYEVLFFFHALTFFLFLFCMIN